MFCYVWEYEVQRDRREEFLAGYGPDGEWEQFFRQAEGWIRTELLHDCDDPLRFVTIDYWTSRERCLADRERRRAAFDAIDRRYESVTLRERHIGDFDLPDEGQR